MGLIYIEKAKISSTEVIKLAFFLLGVGLYCEYGYLFIKAVYNHMFSQFYHILVKVYRP